MRRVDTRNMKTGKVKKETSPKTLVDCKLNIKLHYDATSKYSHLRAESQMNCV